MSAVVLASWRVVFSRQAFTLHLALPVCSLKLDDAILLMVVLMDILAARAA